MIAKVTTGRRITIPKEIFEQMYNAKEGMEVDITFENGMFLVKPMVPTGQFKEKTQERIKPEVKQKISTTNKPKRKIVSNLEEGKNFSTKFYSKCGLVIRTKNRYLNEFCADCRGQLINSNQKENTHICPYVTESTLSEKPKNNKEIKKLENKKLVNELQDNITRLNKTLDGKINNIESDNGNNKNTTISRVKFNNFKCCSQCGEYVNNGFMLDEKFYCKKCTTKDFKSFFIKFKGGNK